MSHSKQPQAEGPVPVLIGLSAAERRRRNRAAMIAAILETAIAIMREAGVAEVSLHEIGRRVGMRAQSLYKYFPSKAALFDALFAEGAGRLLESDRRVWDDTPPDWGRLEAWLVSRLAFAREEGPLYELTTSPSAFGFEWSPESRAIAEAIGKAGAAAIQELVDEGVIGSQISPRRAMNLLLAASRGIVGETRAKEKFFTDPRRLPDLIPDFVSACRSGWSTNFKRRKT